jgi:hypothetical protein
VFKPWFRFGVIGRRCGAFGALLVVLAAAPAAQAADDIVVVRDQPGQEQWTVPPGVTSVTLDVYGAAGGADYDNSGPPGPTHPLGSIPGGKGAHVTGTLAVSPGQVLTLEIGQTPTQQLNVRAQGYTQDGFRPAGGNGAFANGQMNGGNGGGGSGVVLDGVTLAVAGGGGGAGAPDAGRDPQLGAGGAGGASSEGGRPGQPIFDTTGDTTQDCTLNEGQGGLPGGESDPGLGGAGGTTDCIDSSSAQGHARMGDPGRDGDFHFPDPLVGGGGDGANYGTGGGGSGWHGGGGGGAGANSSTSDAGGGGGGGGSNHVDSSLTSTSVHDGVNEGNGKIEIRYKPLGVDIVAAPDERTDSNVAHFEFSAADPSATFECALDGSPFEACSSPQSYGPLQDGGHHFEVRGVIGGETTDSSVWDWTIDTTPPVVNIDQGPSGTVSSDTAQFMFHANELGVAYDCKLDGGPAQPCSSPQTYAGLNAGTHSFAVTAIDSVGNTSAPDSRSWQVASKVPQATQSCSAPTAAKASHGNVFVVGREGTCLTPVTTAGQRVWTASGQVTVNGIVVEPDAGTSITLSSSGAQGVFSTDGPATVKLGTLPAVHLPGGIEWSEAAGGIFQAAGKLVAPIVKDAGGLSALPIWPKISLSAADGGTAKIGLKFALPKEFTAIPGSQQKVSADLGATASNDKGVTFAGKLGIGKVWVGVVEVKDLELGYDSATDSFEGSVGLKLGGELLANTPTLNLGVVIGPPPTLWGPFREASMALQEIDEPIGDTGLFLQEIGAKASEEAGPQGKLDYLRLAGTIGVSAGPEIPVIKQPAVTFDGTGVLSLSDPWKIEVNAQGFVLQFPIANGGISYSPGAGIVVHGLVDETIAGYGLQARITNTFFQGRTRFNVEASGDVILPVIGSQHATAVFSDHGYAACTRIESRWGAYSLGWGVLANGTQVAVGNTCDLGAFSDQSRAARAISADAPWRFTLHGHARVRAIAVRGRTKAPNMTLRGPRGLTLATSDPKSDSGLVIPDAQRQTTYVVLAHAPAGRYTVTSEDEIIGVRAADSLPPVKPRVTTRAVHGGRRLLSYSQAPASDQHLELYDEGRGGVGKLVTSTSHRSGHLTFTPTPGLGRNHKILAVTIRNGLARDRRIVAHYAVADNPPAKVKAVARHGHQLRWAAVPHARAYVVAFIAAGGTSSAVVTKRNHVRIPRSSRAVTIVAMDVLGRVSPAVHLKLTPSKHRKTKHHHGR